MLHNNHGFSIYKVISIVSFLAMIFVLALPQFYDLEAKEKSEQCVKNMEQIYFAVQRYMIERNLEFNADGSEDTSDLKRMGYLEAVLECPEKAAGDKYIIKGLWTEEGRNMDPERRKYLPEEEKKNLIEITVTCPWEKEFPDHKLPPQFK